MKPLLPLIVSLHCYEMWFFYNLNLLLSLTFNTFGFDRDDDLYDNDICLESFCVQVTKGKKCSPLDLVVR